MKKIILIVSLLLVMFVGTFTTSCTDNQRVKSWGGEATIELPVDTKLVNITWKGSEVWYLTRPMRKEEKAETYRFHEESSFGMIEGTYVVKESKTPETSTYPWQEGESHEYDALQYLKDVK